MRSISSALKAHYASEETTLAVLAKFTRVDGVILAVTLGYDKNVTYSGTTYLSAYDLVASALTTSAAMNVDSMDMKGALIALGVSEADINSGLWDNALCEVIRVNWTDLTMGHENLKFGWIGEVSVGRAAFTSELRGLTQKLQSTIGDVVSPSCKRDLGDSKCGVVMTEGVRRFSGVSVTGVTSRRRFVMSSLTQAATTFDGGKVVWTSGLNAGLKMEIKSQTSGGNFELQEPMPYDIAVTDQATVDVGCLKRFTEDCVTKFSNAPRFGGFATLPGPDQTLKGI